MNVDYLSFDVESCFSLSFCYSSALMYVQFQVSDLIIIVV